MIKSQQLSIDTQAVYLMRYALGRMTTAPFATACHLKSVWHELSPSTQNQIKKEIKKVDDKTPGTGSDKDDKK